MKVLKGRKQYMHISNWWHYIKTEILRGNAIKGCVIQEWESGPTLTGSIATPNNVLAEVSIPTSLKKN